MYKEIIHRKMVINNFWSKTKVGQLLKKLLLTFFNFINFMYFVQIFNIKSTDKNRNMHIFYQKNSKVELHSSKTFFWWPSSNFAIFSCKICVTFEIGHDLLCLEA